jgi:hypothetical protein
VVRSDDGALVDSGAAGPIFQENLQSNFVASPSDFSREPVPFHEGACVA